MRKNYKQCFFLSEIQMSIFDLCSKTMIAFLKGRLVHKEPTYLLIDVGGVGYKVKISLQTFSAIGLEENIQIFTHLQIKEDSHSLFGFHTREEQELFEHLISVSGIGAGTAIIILSSLSSGEIIQAIVSEDVMTIQKMKGVGPKTAQRAVLELKDKLKKELLATGINPSMFAGTNLTLRSEALTALTTLGIARAAAEKSVDQILKRTGGDIKLEELIKLALR